MKKITKRTPRVVPKSAPREWPAEELANVQDAAELQLALPEIADIAACDVGDLSAPEPAEAIRRGYLLGEVACRKALLASARAGNVRAVEMFADLVRARQKAAKRREED